MSNKDWTNNLPELLEGFTEPEPEGLWDAVRSAVAPRRRHVIAAWWYAAGALLAAAISAVFFLWPSRPVHPSVTPVAEVTSVPDPVTSVSDPVIAVPERQSHAENIAPDAKTPQNAAAAVPEASLRLQNPPETLPQRCSTPESSPEATPEATPEGAPESTPPSPISPGNEDKTPESASVPPDPVIPDEVGKPHRHAPSIRLQLGVSRTGYLAQATMATTTGVGIPVNLGIRPGAQLLTKASSTGSSDESVMARMLSRNRASTTDAVHGQSARLALGVTVGITEHWAVETGVVSSSLFSRYQTDAGSGSETLSRTMKYCGIPLYARYNALEWKRLSLFLNAGPMYEFTTKTSVNKTTFAGRAQTGYTSDNTLVKDVKWSLNAGGGVQFRVLEHGALYVLPGVSYHFAGNSTLENFYTEHPLSASVTFGYNFVF